MNDSGTMYDFMSNDYEAPITEVVIPTSKEKPKEQEFKHANRQDLSKPYSHTERREEEVEQSARLTPKNSAECEWWRWYTNQQTNCEVAQDFNRQFKKPVADYAEEKARYITEFNKLKAN